MLAGITPAVPERSLPNSVLYETEDALEAALPTLAATYDEAGIDAWTVWVPEHHERARAVLADAGHELDATPTAMIAGLDDVERARAGRSRAGRRPVARGPRADQRPRLRHRRRLPADPRRRPRRSALQLHRAPRRRAGGLGREPGPRRRLQHLVGGHGPRGARARPRGRASCARALADGRARGCEVSTLQATKLGRPVYERLGYRALRHDRDVGAARAGTDA